MPLGDGTGRTDPAESAKDKPITEDPLVGQTRLGNEAGRDQLAETRARLETGTIGLETAGGAGASRVRTPAFDQRVGGTRSRQPQASATPATGERRVRDP